MAVLLDTPPHLLIITFTESRVIQMAATIRNDVKIGMDYLPSVHSLSSQCSNEKLLGYGHGLGVGTEINNQDRGFAANSFS